MTITPLTYEPLHPTFGAEVRGADFTNITPELAADIKAGIAKYGVLVFRDTGLDDDRHVALSGLLGELDDITPYSKMGRKNRLKYDQLFDVSNIDGDGNLMPADHQRQMFSRGNMLFHVDSSFNPRRAGYSLLLSHEIPPPGNGGNTEFADCRTAYDDLDDATKDRIKDYVLWHSQHHSRRKANPGVALFDEPKVGKHTLVPY